MQWPESEAHGGYQPAYPAYPVQSAASPAYPAYPAYPVQGAASPAYPAYPAYPVQGAASPAYPAYPAYPVQGAASPAYPAYPTYPVQGAASPAYPAYPTHPVHGVAPYPCGCSGAGRPEDRQRPDLRDNGGNPHVINIEEAAEFNTDFRRAIWTGRHLQVVLMSIRPGEDIGLEVHPNVDQFIRIEEGTALVQMGPRRNSLNFVRRVSEDDAIMIPAGTWHNVTNIGPRPLKLYTIYAPPEHPFGTVERTKPAAGAAREEEKQ